MHTWNDNEAQKTVVEISGWSNWERVRFCGYSGRWDTAIEVHVGGLKALMSRDELQALAKMFPPAQEDK